MRLFIKRMYSIVFKIIIIFVRFTNFSKNYYHICSSTIQKMCFIVYFEINFIIRKILSMEFKDTQCGAKIFHKDVIELLFEEKFITKWLFDVELFMRLRKHYKIKKAKEMVCEMPLKRWVHVDGSKLSMKDSIKTVGQLANIAISYNLGWRRKSKKKKNNIIMILIFQMRIIVIPLIWI